MHTFIMVGRVHAGTGNGLLFGDCRGNHPAWSVSSRVTGRCLNGRRDDRSVTGVSRPKERPRTLTHACAHTHTYIHAHTCTSRHKHTCTCAHTHTLIRAHMHTHTHQFALSNYLYVYLCLTPNSQCNCLKECHYTLIDYPSVTILIY